MARGIETIKGLQRLKWAVSDIDKRTADIIALHLHMEREMDRALAMLFPRPDRLKLGFTQKVCVLEAMIPLPGMDDLGKAIIALNNLRNAIAHVSTSKREIDGCCEALSKIVCTMWPQLENPSEVTIESLVGFICGALSSYAEGLIEPIGGSPFPGMNGLHLLLAAAQHARESIET